MKSKLTITIGSIHAQGIEPSTVLGRLTALKRDLESKGCIVSINVAGQELDAIEVVSLPDELKAENDKWGGSSS